MPVTRAYIDGFNLYRTLLRASPDLKWLDFQSLWPQMFHDIPVEKTYYFTSSVHALPLDNGAPMRQQKYLDALKSTPSVEVVMGNFNEDSVVARPLNGRIHDRVEGYRNRERDQT